MGDQLEMISEQTDDTRSQLSEKLEVLENQVADTVQSATEAVAETVEAVKETVENVTETVQETVQSVGAAFDLELQAKRHPWLVFGGSVALGCLAVRLLGGPRKSTKKRPRTTASSFRPTTSHATAAKEGQKSWFRDQVERLGGLAISSVMGAVREKIAQAVPEALRERVVEEVDHLTSSLGGEPIPDPRGNGRN